MSCLPYKQYVYVFKESIRPEPLWFYIKNENAENVYNLMFIWECWKNFHCGYDFKIMDTLYSLDKAVFIDFNENGDVTT